MSTRFYRRLSDRDAAFSRGFWWGAGFLIAVQALGWLALRALT